MGSTLSPTAVNQLREVVRRVLREELFSLPTGRTNKGIMSQPLLLSKSSSEFTVNTTATVTVYAGTTPGSETATTSTVGVYNRFGTVPLNHWLVLGFVSGHWDIIAANPCT